MKLWLVESPDSGYDETVSVLVASVSERGALRHARRGPYPAFPRDRRLTVKEVPLLPGILHLHWRAG
jgi:hypothetical protein